MFSREFFHQLEDEINRARYRREIPYEGRMSYLADDTAAIKARMDEIKADLRQALTGSSAPAAEESKQTKEFDSDGMYAYPCGYKVLYGG